MSPTPLHKGNNLRKLVVVLFALLFTALAISYITFQARFLIAGPSIVLDDNIEVVQSERLVRLSGQTSNIVNITLNGRQIFTDQSGHFDEALILENGYTRATILAEDRYGRKTAVEQEFVYVGTDETEPMATIQE